MNLPAIKPVMTRARGELKPMPTYEVVLEGVLLGKGFARRYAAICRNWHIGFLGLNLPLAEVFEEKCDREGKSWTYAEPTPDPGWMERRRASQYRKLQPAT